MRITSTWVKVVIAICIVVVAFMFLQAYAFAVETDDSKAGSAESSTLTNTSVTQIASRNGGPCYRGAAVGFSNSWVFGRRATWELFAEWCANRARTKIVSLRSLIASDRNVGYFQHDPPCSDSHGSTGLKNIFTRGECEYYIVSSSVGRISRNGWIRMWLGPKGGMSGTFGWGL